MTAVVLLASVVLAAVAAAGIMRPFGRRAPASLERVADPLEDERASLLRSLRDLDDEHRSGLLSDADHAALRADTEVRAVAVLRALEARDRAGDLAVGLKELRPAGAASANGGNTTPGRRRFVPGLVVAGVLIAVTVPLLAGAMANRSPGGTITGDDVGVAPDSLSFFERRVQDHPGDVAARLDLAERYGDAGQSAEAATQYLVALRLDPRNVEANAALGFILYQAGKAEEGLRAVRSALTVDPTNPEALYEEGIILWQGLHRYAEAEAAFRAYLAAAPFGSHRDEVQGYLDRSVPAGG